MLITLIYCDGSCGDDLNGVRVTAFGSKVFTVCMVNIAQPVCSVGNRRLFIAIAQVNVIHIDIKCEDIAYTIRRAVVIERELNIVAFFSHYDLVIFGLFTLILGICPCLENISGSSTGDILAINKYVQAISVVIVLIVINISGLVIRRLCIINDLDKYVHLTVCGVYKICIKSALVRIS